MADDDDFIAVDIRPVLDESATERETGKLRDKFKEGAKGVGKSISDVLHSEFVEGLEKDLQPEIRQAIDGVLGFAGDKAKDLGHGLSKEIGTAIGGSLGDAVKDLGDALTDSSIDVVSGRIRDKLGDVKKNIDDVKKSFADLKEGNYGEVLKKIDENADKLPDPLKKVHDQVKPISDSFNEIKSTGKDVIDIFAGLEIISPRLAAGLTAVAGPLGEIAGSLAMVPKVDDWLKHLPGGLGSILERNLPDTGNWEWLKQPFRVMGGDIMHPSRLGEMFGTHNPYDRHGNYIGRPASPPAPPPPPPNPGAGGNFLPALPGIVSGGGGMGIPPNIAPPDTGGAHTSGFGSGGIRVTLADFTTPTTPTISGPEDIPSAAAGVSNLYRFAESLVGTPYSQKLRNDCSGMVSELANVAVGLPPPGPGQRFSTVDEGQRLAQLGFQPGMGGPNDLNIGWYDHGGGNYGHTAATLPGGVNAESGGSHGSFLLGPGAAGASNPEFTQHAHLPMGPESFLGAPGARARLTGYGGMPTLPGLGGYAPPPTQGNTYNPTSQPGLGHGSGVGVSGGMIGLAEQAGAMAAGAMSFGGGAIAAQMAEQEMNLAIQKGGQMAAVLAKAPFETFGLHGGQMGAPSVDPGGGWVGKILGGMIGQQFNQPNIAGATQAPKQPQSQDQQDPAGGNGGKPPSSAGPAGTRDDPHYTKIVGGGGQPPQGGLTSAMSATGVMSAMV